MPGARLKFSGRELTIGEGVTTLGRSSDNHVSFPEDSNVSRYHVEIESRIDDFWLIDLGSSNGTLVNGEKVGADVLLREGDQILLGGSSELIFTYTLTDDEETLPIAENADQSESEAGLPNHSESAEETPPAEEKPASKKGCLLGAAGLLCGLAIVFVVGAVLFSSRCGTPAAACDAQAAIVKPEVGDTISKPVKIEIATKNDSCAASAIYYLDGQEFAASEKKPFDASINPAKHPRLADGFVHKLSMALFDKKGTKISESGAIQIAFETREVEKPRTDETPGEGNVAEITPKDSKNDRGGKVSIIETKNLVESFVKLLPGTSRYQFSPEFFQEVQKKTSEYISPGFFARASNYKDVINEAYVKEQDLDPVLGYMLAMSRTKFTLTNDAAGDGLWRMPGDFVSSNGYDQFCGANKSLSDPAQICAAKASSLYLKALVIGVFEGDIIYSVAAFGKSPQTANIWKAQLPANRTDFWNVIKTPNEREQVVRFFAAAAVAQNPEKFGLKGDRPISELYGFILRK